MTKYPVKGKYGTYLVEWKYDEYQDERVIRLFVDTGRRFFGKFKYASEMHESELYENMADMDISTTNHYIAESVAMVAIYEEMVEIKEEIEDDLEKFIEEDRKELEEWDGVVNYVGGEIGNN